MTTNPAEGRQAPSPEWREQWTLFQDDERFLFEEWIRPARLEELAGLDVLEAGCGGGQHTSFMAPIAATVTAVDLNTAELARRRNRDHPNVRFVEDDIATMDLGRRFDVALSIGVVHHTDDPDRTFENLYRHVRPGGRLILWVYGAEGNAAMRYVVEPLRRRLLARLPRRLLVWLARGLTAALYPVVHTVYRLPFLRFLPYYDYFANFRRLSFERNVLNVFDKLNAPQTHFLTRERCRRWFSDDRFEPDSISIRRYAGVSYSLVGTRRRD